MEREQALSLYSVKAYFVPKIVTELPQNILGPLLQVQSLVAWPSITCCLAPLVLPLASLLVCQSVSTHLHASTY